MKKIKMLACLSAACCLLPGMLSVMPADALTISADVPEGLTYEITADNTVTIKKWDDSAPFLDIPAEIEGIPVTKIGRSAFSYCTALEQLTLPDSVTEIGDSAFAGCYLLKEFEFPDSVTKLSGSLFSSCYRLEHVKLPAHVDAADSRVFDGCAMLQEITIPEGTPRMIGAFLGNCGALRRVVVPESVTQIGLYALTECEQLVTVVVENPECKFEDDPKTICNGISRENDEPYFDGVIYGYEGSTAEAYAEKYGYTFAPISEVPEDDPLPPENLPKGMRFIREDDHIMITNWFGLEDEVVLPSELYGLPVTAVDRNALHFVSMPRKVTVPDSVTEIGEFAFSGNPDLEEVILSNSLTALSKGIFASCTGLTSITIPDSVTTIDESAFSSCSGLTTVTVPESVTLIRGRAFSSCKNLEQVILPNHELTVLGYAFTDCSALTDINFPDSTTVLTGNVLSNTGFRTFEFPEQLTEIEGGVFNGCKKLEEVTIPASVERIGNAAFRFCPQLKSVTILNPDCEIYDAATTFSNVQFSIGTKEYSGVIRGYAGSTAEAYAEKYGYTFEVIEGSPNPNPFLLGDVNFDGSVDAADAQITLTAYLETLVNKPLGLTDRQILAADIDTDNTVTASDAQYILIYYLRNTVSKIPTTWEEIMSLQ